MTTCLLLISLHNPTKHRNLNVVSSQSHKYIYHHIIITESPPCFPHQITTQSPLVWHYTLSDSPQIPQNICVPERDPSPLLFVVVAFDHVLYMGAVQGVAWLCCRVPIAITYTASINWIRSTSTACILFQQKGKRARAIDQLALVIA